MTNGTHWNAPEWLLRRIPKRNPKPLLCEADCYGAGRLIAIRTGRLDSLPSGTAWLHGWIWEPVTHPRQLAQFTDPDRPLLVATERNARFLRAAGYTRVQAAGLPFAHVPRLAVSRIEGSLLVMPPHSLPWTDHAWNENLYATYVASLRSRFATIVACVSGSCVDKGHWTNELERVGIPWIRGAELSDQNGLLRMAALFRSFEFMTTSCMGSHVAYAAYSGCRVSIAGPYMGQRASFYTNDPLYRKYPDLLEANLGRFDPAVVKEHYPFLFCEPHEALPQPAFGAEAVGEAWVKSPREMAELLGWPLLPRWLETPRTLACSVILGSGRFGEILVDARERVQQLSMSRAQKDA